MTTKTKLEQFGDRLRAIRNARGISQADLAERVGVHPVTVSHWESGKREPGGMTLIEIARSLRVSPFALTGETQPATEAAISDYLASPYYALREAEGAPVRDIELHFLRYVIESLWVEGKPTPRALDAILTLARTSPEIVSSGR